MPELPDITVYVECLRKRVLGEVLERLRVRCPFLLRTVDPPADAVEGGTVRVIMHLGKRIVFVFDGELYLVFHLMIAGRFQWKPARAASLSKICRAALDFRTGSLLLTEAGQKKRASLHIVRGAASLAELNPGGLDVLAAGMADFIRILRSQNRTLKRALTDPHLFSGIGNAYSDEILHAAGLSPVRLTQRLTDAEAGRLWDCTKAVLTRWIDSLRKRFAERFPGPGDITAFREEFAVHGRYGKPCPACGDTVQRIRYAENETNYCPTCQNAGRILADRSLSRLLKNDWPRQAHRPRAD